MQKYSVGKEILKHWRLVDKSDKIVTDWYQIAQTVESFAHVYIILKQ